jgi:hypothetical protein
MRPDWRGGVGAVAVPWLQIVNLVPSILDVSRELLKRTKRPPAPQIAATATPTDAALADRIAVLEENERQQAELINQMAEQHAALARAVTALHRQLIRIGVAAAICITLTLVALAVAVSH